MASDVYEEGEVMGAFGSGLRRILQNMARTRKSLKDIPERPPQQRIGDLPRGEPNPPARAQFGDSAGRAAKEREIGGGSEPVFQPITKRGTTPNPPAQRRPIELDPEEAAKRAFTSEVEAGPGLEATSIRGSGRKVNPEGAIEGISREDALFSQELTGVTNTQTVSEISNREFNMLTRNMPDEQLETVKRILSAEENVFVDMAVNPEFREAKVRLMGLADKSAGLRARTQALLDSRGVAPSTQTTEEIVSSLQAQRFISKTRVRATGVMIENLKKKGVNLELFGDTGVHISREGKVLGDITFRNRKLSLELQRPSGDFEKIGEFETFDKALAKLITELK